MKTLSDIWNVVCTQNSSKNSELHGATQPDRFQNLFVNDLDLKNTNGQNIGNKQVNVKQPNIFLKFSLYGARMVSTSVKW